MKFKDFQAPVLFSSTFKALNLKEKNSRTFKDAWEPCNQVCQQQSQIIKDTVEPSFPARDYPPVHHVRRNYLK